MTDALLSAIEAWARTEGDRLTLHVHEDNARAIASYERRGFTFSGHAIPYNLDPSKNELEMVKELSPPMTFTPLTLTPLTDTPRGLAECHLPAGTFTLRRATATDVGAIVSLLADDQLRASFESTTSDARAPYDRAFEAINADPAQLLVVAVSTAGDVVATMQLTSIPGMARAGALRMQIEAVRVHSSLRGNGLGGAMIGWAIAEGRRRGARLVQLTSDQSRQSAHRFYEGLGFEASHVGFKLTL